MNKRISSLIIIMILCLQCGNAFGISREAQEIVGRLESKSQQGVSLPKVGAGSLKNGFQYYILPDSEIPQIKAVIYIKGGTIFDPPGKSGFSQLLAESLREGGTKELTPAMLEDRLDTIASSIGISAKQEYLLATIVSRSEHFKETLSILLDMLFAPRFDEERIQLIKKRYKNAIKRRIDSPDVLADIGFDELLYGRDNPWGDYPTIASVDKITIDELKKFNKEYFHPANMIIGIAGDISARSAIKMIGSYENYPDGEAIELKPPSATPAPKKGVHLINKDSNQVVFNIGHQGSTRFDPDKFKLILMNDILGGGPFNRILPQLIRVEGGLAYSVWSSYMFGPRNAPGVFKVYLATKTESTTEALKIVESELDKFSRGEGITEDGLNRSKRSILEGLIFEYATPFSIVSSIVKFRYFDYPDNYIEIYADEIGKVELKGVIGAAHKYIHPDKLQVVLVGDRKLLEKQFKDNIKYSDLTIDE